MGTQTQQLFGAMETSAQAEAEVEVETDAEEIGALTVEIDDENTEDMIDAEADTEEMGAQTQQMFHAMETSAEAETDSENIEGLFEGMRDVETETEAETEFANEEMMEGETAVVVFLLFDSEIHQLICLPLFHATKRSYQKIERIKKLMKI